MKGIAGKPVLIHRAACPYCCRLHILSQMRRYEGIVIQASTTGRQVGLGRTTNGDRDAGAAMQAAEAAVAEMELQSSARYSNSDTGDVYSQIGDALAMYAINGE